MAWTLFDSMARFENDETVVSRAVSNSNSLRSTIPLHIAKKLELNPGDRVEWDLDKEDGVWLAKIIKK